MTLTWDDISAMTNEKLRIAIALRNGWEKCARHDDSVMLVKKDAFLFGDIADDGRKINLFGNVVPDWTGNLDTAFDLLNKALANDETMKVEITSVYQFWHVRIRSGIRAFSAEDPSLAVAICRAWLCWKDGLS